MTTHIMRGARTARMHLSNHLQATVPSYVVAARTEWNAMDWEFPIPTRFDSYDPLKFGRLPCVGSVVRRTSRWKRIEIRDGSEIYDARYSMLLFVWVKTPVDPATETHPEDPYGAALSLRDDLMALLRTSILSTPSLGSGGKVEVDESTLEEDYLDAFKVSDQSPLWIAGGTIAFDMRVGEANRHVPIGTANQINVEVRSTQLPMEQT